MQEVWSINYLIFNPSYIHQISM